MSKPSTDSNRIWYNITIPYNKNNAPFDTPAEYEENRVQPLINNPSEYDLVIARFQLFGQTIPICLADIQNFPNVNPDLTTWSITLNHNGDIQQVFIIFVPEQLDISQPPPPSATHPTQFFTRYYSICNFEHLITLFNTAFTTAFGALAAPPAGSAAPYLQYNEDLKTVEFVCTRAGYDGALAAANRIDVFVNNPAYKFFSSFDSRFFGKNQPSGQDYQFVIADKHNNWYQPPDQAIVSPPLFYKLGYQWNILPYWNTVDNLVFTTGSIPVNYEYINSYDNLGGMNTGTDNFSAILTDFLIPVDLGAESRVALQYTPQTLSRRIPMNGTTPLTKIDIRVFWKDIFGNLYPLQIAYDQYVSMKLLFVKKNVQTD